MLERITDLMLGAASRTATLVADDDYRLVLTRRFGGLILPRPPPGRGSRPR